MKRNAMLGEIFNILWKNTYELSNEECEDISNKILDEIEEKGMIPSVDGCNLSEWEKE